MRRREFIAGVGSALAWPSDAGAQQASKIARLGFLGAISASKYATQVEAFLGGLHDLGYVEGKNIAIEFRWAEGNYDRLPELAAEFERLKIDVLVTQLRRSGFQSPRASSLAPRSRAGTSPE